MGLNLLAMIVFEKFGQHQPLSRRIRRSALVGKQIALSAMVDAVGGVCAEFDALRRSLAAHVIAADRLHEDETTAPMLAQGKTDTGRLWTYCTMTGRSPELGRRRSSITRAIDAASISMAISRATPASCKPTLTTATTDSNCRIESRGRSRKQRV